MRYTHSAIGLLTRQYKSVLVKCLLINAGLFLMAAPALADLKTAVQSTAEENTYTLTDETLTSTLGTMGATRLTINGSATVDGNSAYGGITVNSGKSLILSGTSDSARQTWTRFARIAGNSSSVVFVDNGGTVSSSNVDFNNNSADWGGVFKINNGASASTISGNFNNNIGKAGGVIFNYGSIDTIDGTFSENKSNTHGGAIYNGDASWQATIGSLSGVFNKNEATNYGGVAYVANGSLGSVSGTFSENEAQYGGVVYIKKGRVTSFTGSYESNEATNWGGVLVNYDTVGSMEGIYEQNTAQHGGVLFNYGGVSSLGGTYSRNTVTNYGGVIYNGDSSWQATIDSISGTFENNKATKRGGVIYMANGSIDSISGSFSENESEIGGVLYVNNGRIDAIDGLYENNKATNLGGVICNISALGSIDGTYTENEARHGGVLFNYGTVDSISGEFTGNTSTTHGAVIYNGDMNYADATITKMSGKYSGNSAGGVGGVLYISGGKVLDLSGEFTNNSANEDGGFAYLDSNAEATLNITTTTGNTLFSGNTGNGVSNAIHNRHIVNMNADADHTITFDDGINGYYGTININDAAVKSNMTDGTIIFNNSVAFNEVILNAGTLKLGDNADLSEAWKFNMQGGTLDLSGDDFVNYSLPAVTIASADAKLKIDLSSESSQADALSIDAKANGTLTLTEINLSDYYNNAEDTVQIIYNQASDYAVELAIDDNIKTYVGVKDEAGADGLKADIQWNEDIGAWEQTTTSTTNYELAKSDENSVYDSIGYTTDVEVVRIYAQDRSLNLAALNQSENFAEKSFNFDTANDEYKVGIDLGETSGNLTINGVADDEDRKSVV